MAAQTVGVINKSHKIDPLTQVGDSLSYEPKIVLKTGNGTPKFPNIAFAVCISGYYGQTVGDMNKTHKMDPPQVGYGLSYEQKNRKTGSEAPKILMIAFPVSTSDYYGKTVGDINKSPKVDPPQVGDSLSYEPKNFLQNRKWGP